MSQRNRQAPSNWDAYERGRADSVDSLTSIREDDNQTASHGSPSSPSIAIRNRTSEDHNGQTLRGRRSSVFNSIRQIGGINNIDNFARSFQRAAGYREITPMRRNSITYTGELGDDSGRMSTSPRIQKSLIRQQLENAQQTSPEEAITDVPVVQIESDETAPLLPTTSRASTSVPSYLAADNVSNIGTSYGSISSRLTARARDRASILIQEHQEASLRARAESDEMFKDDLTERLVEIEERPDGEIIERIVGESTVPMTIFNSTNVLIGVGILALPLAIKYSGWVLGLSFLTLAALVTRYTAMLLAKCLDTNIASTTYGDIAFLAFGHFGRGFIELLFVIELLAANVALIILFSDSMNSLVSAVSVPAWKCILALGLIPLNFTAFKTLSIGSVLGIACCIGILFILVLDGFLKPHSPGSLRHVAVTYAFPANWRTIPLSLGLFMSPWGGHSVFPAVYKDMRHPQKYAKALRVTYIFTYGLDTSMAILGYLMFGDLVRDEVTSNILQSTAYPQALSIIIVLLIAVIPITKLPLSNRPMMDTINKKFYIDLRQMDAKAREYSLKSWKHRFGRGSIAILCNVLELIIALFFPDFDSIMALMGSALCFTICVILPVLFYLRMFGSAAEGGISLRERIFCWMLIVICSILAVIGTIFAIIPKDKIGIESCTGRFLQC